MADHPPVLIAPDAFGGDLRAPVVAAAIGRGLERAGVAPPPELCAVSSGGPGTIEVLLPALGGETGDGFALLEDGGTALVECNGDGARTGARLAAAAATGAAVVVLAVGPGPGPTPPANVPDCGPGYVLRDVHRRAVTDGGELISALDDHGGLRGAALVVLCDARAPAAAAVALRDERGARLVAGAPFVLDELAFDARMRAARAVIVGEPRLDRATLLGRVAGEIATRARQAGVPCHAVTAEHAIDRFDARILDLQAIVEATTVAELEAAGAALAEYL